MGTPLSGPGPNGGIKFKTATYGPVGKAGKPISKKVNLPPLGRDTAGRINLGLGNGS